MYLSNSIFRKHRSICKRIIYREVRKLPVCARKNEMDELMNRALFGVFMAYKNRKEGYADAQFIVYLKYKVRAYVSDMIRKFNRRNGKFIVTTDIINISNGEDGDIVDYLSYIKYSRKSIRISTRKRYAQVMNLLESFRQRDKDMLFSHYIDGKTMTSIAKKYDITLSRVSQILKNMVNTIKDNIAN